MSMKLIEAVRKCGWTDTRGRQQYGNAAVLSFLSSCMTRTNNLDTSKVELVKALIHKYGDVPVKELARISAISS